jgi:hypothetical protein
MREAIKAMVIRQRQVGVLDGKEAENMLIGGKGVEGGFRVFERVAR